MGRIFILKPPPILYKLRLIPPRHAWLVHKAIYGLQAQVITRVTFTSEGETCSVPLSAVHKSLCLIVKHSSTLTDRSTDFTGLTSKVLPSDVVAMSGVYVNDFLNVGRPRHVVTACDSFTDIVENI